MMKVAFISDYLLGGGKERRLIEIIQGLIARGHIKPIIILLDGKCAKDSIAYKSILNFSIPIYFLGGEGHFKSVFQIYKILKQEKVKAINTWAPPIYSIYLIYAQMRLKLPVYNSSITGARDSYSRKEKFVMHNIYRISTLVNSNCERAMILFNIPINKRKVIYNGFNFLRLDNIKSSTSIREQFKITTKFIVSMAGRYSDAKDWPTHVRAANIILDYGYDVTFLCMGSGDPTQYEKLIKIGYENRILFVGHQDDVESIYAASDIVTLSTFGEGISNSILEGMAVSKPIVATEGGGTPEIIQNGKSGYITKKGDVNDYANHIIKLLKNENLRKSMGEYGLYIVKQKFNINQMVDGFENMLMYGI